VETLRKDPCKAKQLFQQGCQMVYFKTKNSNLGIFWRVLEWTMYILRPFGIIYGRWV
jgi:hypothetical protein